MLTKNGHGVAAYILLLLALSHWLAGRRLVDAEVSAATTDPEPD